MKFSDLKSKHYLHNSNLKSLLGEIANGTTAGKLLSNPTLAIGSVANTKVKTSAFDYIKNGVIKTVAGAETAFTATTHDLADGYEAIYVLSLKLANESFVLTMGTAAKSSEASAVAPATPTGHLKLGEVKIATSGAAFDATTTALNAETLTVTYANKTDIFNF